ncbi:SGNH hydrolase-like domain-containing protein, acetyltransferase AlgX [Fibrobacter sp. UWB16]|uniref:alginate O-acetyltransferase AlgX-related protein n=1 Tax=unclassified Fibrobacter TaxID=2634177 RepID=UPI000B520371|nr:MULTISPECIES: hypothetical protein [unclassified Fibrobacter]OWV22814.1 hypothetical protein B7991_01175 [Fibrobacter sp. UWB3]SOD13889.1 SGNH hydrolase-like domain-containing protein, acetyltransferase AlgX [Fibrobacter sp. UWB16]
MNKKYIIPVVIFSILLLLPFGVQAVADLRGEKRFQPFDIFKDVVYTPIVREKKVAAAADSLDVKWRAAREAIAAGTETADALEPVVSALSDLEAAVLSVNTYAELDTAEARYKSLKLADTLLSKLEDEPESFPQADSCIKALVADLGHVSLWRAFLDVKHYGVWTSRYLRAFENKIDDESAIVLALRPKYQLAVWNLFSDPGEKVVLGAAGDCIGKSCGRENAKPEDKWLFYRQDVEFLVQPSPLDVRSAKLDNPVKAIEKFRDQLKAKGVELLVVITPGKPSIYTERLTGLDENAAGLQSHGKNILDSLTRAGFNTVDLYTPLLAAKSRDSVEGSLYLNDDTHWTPRGAELAAAEIAAAVNRLESEGKIKLKKLQKHEDGSYPLSFVTKDSVADRMGDVGEMSGLNKFGVFKVQKVTGHVVMQQNIKIRDEELPEDTVCIDSAYKECMNRKKADRKDAETTDVFCLLTSQTACAFKAIKYDTTITPFKDDFRKSEILILGDSFSRIYQTDSPVNAGWIAHFAKNMNRPVASIVSDGGASTLVREKLARKASVLKGKKLLIWEFVERDLRFGAEGWKDVEF